MYISKGQQYAFLAIIVVILVVANMLEIITMPEKSGTSSGEGVTSGKSIDANSLPEASSSSEDDAKEIPIGVPMSSEENFRRLKKNAEQPSLHNEGVGVDEDK